MTLGPDGWARVWLSQGQRAPEWAGVIKDELVGPFWVENGTKAIFHKTDFDVPSHISKNSTVWMASKGLKDGKLMAWPPSSPDFNPIENF